MKNITTYLGSPYPLGTTLYKHGVNFSLCSEHATGVVLCLFDEEGNETRIPVTEVYHTAAPLWHLQQRCATHYDTLL